MKPWTEYNITLRRFYIAVDEEEILPMKVGRAATVTIRTNPSEPAAPKDVRLVLSEKKNLLLEIKSPEFWNGPPSKYRIRWEPKDRRRGSSGYRDIDIASTWTPKQKWTTTNVTLEPGLQYKVFVSAQNSISTGVSFWGPEYANEVTTIPLDPVDLVAESLTPTEVLISWRSAGHSEYFQVSVITSHISPQPLVSQLNINIYIRLRIYLTHIQYYSLFQISSDSNGEEQFHARVIVDSEQLASSEQSLMVDDLLPSRNYTVKVLACTSNECSGKRTAKVTTKPT
uniref:Fibronectin type-III domain-containing protein n=1 Tax=Ixodes scapularis TaxID=6945 RepID=A0A1S4M4J0_IXOSC